MIKKTIWSRLNALFYGTNKEKYSKAMVVQTAEGVILFIYTENGEISEGMQVVLADATGQPTEDLPPDGNYTLQNGTVISVMEGIISSIQQMQMNMPPAQQFQQPVQVDATAFNAMATNMSKMMELMQQLTTEVLAQKNKIAEWEKAKSKNDELFENLKNITTNYKAPSGLNEPTDTVEKKRFNFKKTGDQRVMELVNKPLK